MFSSLMTSRRFAPLFWCQFFAALNDNFVKNALVILILYSVTDGSGPMLVTLTVVALIIPSFFLSALGGEMADRYDKAMIARRLKFAEIPVAGIAAAGFILNSIPLLFLALALLGVMAALFGPVKYGMLPDQLTTEELVSGNAFVEGATFMAILGGTIAGGYAAAEAGSPWLIAGLIMVMAVASWLAARMIPSTGAGAPHLKITANPLTSTWALVKELKSTSRLWTGALIVSWFWVVGAVSLSLLPAIVKTKLNGTPGVVTLCLAIFSIGIAIGSGIAAKSSHDRPNLSLVPLGAFAMAVFCLDLAWTLHWIDSPSSSITPAAMMTSVSGFRILFDLFALAVAGGLFIVPAFAAVQAWADPAKRARVIASVNVLNAAFIASSGLLIAVLQNQGVSLSILFGALGLSTAVVGFMVRQTWSSEIAAGDRIT